MQTVRGADLEQTVRRIADPVAAGLGLEIVDTALNRRGPRWHLRLDIDRAGPTGVRLEDCATLSRAVEAALDESNVVGDNYVLDVSSPGIDRPIRSGDDIRRNTGRSVMIETREPFEGRRSFQGVLLGGSEQTLDVRESNGDEFRIPRALIVVARQEIEFKTRSSGRRRSG